MKKLLVTAIGAAAAFGAIADTISISTQRFKEVTSGSVPKESIATILDSAATPSGTYWSDPVDITNEYKVSAVDIGECHGTIDANPGKALEIKTTFGKPLSLNVVSGGTATNIPNSGIYFDSLVKFTVCEDEPDQEYSGAKIVMWLQEVQNANNDPIGTNLMVRAGYLTYSGGVSVVPTNYVCGTEIGPDFADKWHRVTIKAMADITTDTGVGDVKVPGFAIFLDGNTEGGTATGVASDDPKWNAAFESAFSLSEAADDLGEVKLFPSMIQDDNVTAKMTIASAGFDGTGSITDIVFTDKAPDFAKDYVAPRAYVTIGGKEDEYGTLAEAITAVNAEHSGDVTLKLAKGMELTEPIVFTTEANLVLDFDGYVLTNNLAVAAITNLNAESLVVMNSSGKGGILCTVNDTVAMYHDAGIIQILGGNFWADHAIKIGEHYLGENKVIAGGAFASDMSLGDGALVDGKKFASTATPETGLYEVVALEYYTVTFMNGEAQFATTNVLENTVVVAPSLAPTKAGHTFAYWYTSDEAVEYNFATPVTGALTLNAKFTANAYTVTFMNGEAQFATTNVAYNTVVVAPSPAPTKTGHTFAYWYTNDEAVQYDFATPVTGALTLNAKFTANTYTVTFYTNSFKYAEVEYTYGNAGSYTPPANPSVSGYTFGGWYTDNGTFNTAFEFSATAGEDQDVYAKLTSDGPTPIDPGSDTPKTVVEADNEANAIKAATITPPAGVDAAAYKANFDFSAKSNGDGTYTVTMTGIKDSVTEGAASTAVAEVLSATTGGSGEVTIPAGLYYKITTMTALDDKSPTVTKPSTPSTGKVTVTKPGTDKGFIKVELGTKAFE